ncbi:MAG: hypothetical protein CVV58_01205 [Tenericutes bacterium HGW-Tenericutes-3]|nr:MAG: hypothetical protein CVV58_01205 [Tenericutes bacterium HGW-Tenericutes-3]
MAKLVNIASELNYEYKKPHAYGQKLGFDFTVEETLSESTMIIYFLISEITTTKIESLFAYFKQNKKPLKILSFEIKGFVVRVVWNHNFGTMNSSILNDLIENITNQFERLDILPNNVCGLCGKEDPTTIAKVNGIILFKAHEECKREKIEELKQVETSKPVEKPNYVGGVIGALIGALVGTIPWILVELYVGFYAAILGMLIGFSAFFAYKKFGGPLNKTAKYIIAIATIIGVIFTNIFFASYIIYLADGALVLENYIIVYTDPEINGILFEGLGLGLLMSVFALPSIIRKVKSEEKRTITLE